MNDNIHKSYRILNLEGAWFIQNKEGKFIFSTTEDKVFKNKEGKEIKIKPNKYKLFNATMPYSVETIRAFDKLPDEVIEDELITEQHTKLFVNFKFTKEYIDDAEEDDKATKINKKKLRKLIYTSTVMIDDIEYCFFKRGASKARTANVLFVKKEYHDILYNPCLLGLKFKVGEEYDITSKEAYTSLIMSGIIGTIDIQKDEILIINDLMSPSFKAKQTVTRMDEKGNIYQETGEFDVVNNMTDGQTLLDESIYLENDILNESTCALLRNDFFKGNAVRTRLQEYYKQNNITQVWDMYRGWIDASRIKLVVTPSACKYLKFADQFTSEKECFLDWLNKIPSIFGVVKTDHIGNYGYSNRLSYQMLNSMNLNFSKNEVKNLIKDELEYYKFLKDNTLATSEDVRKMTKKNKSINREMRNQMGHFLDLLKENKTEEELSTGDMITALLNRNSDFRLTEKFKDWKKEQLQAYVDNLRLGKIRIKNSLYAIMVSCPYEMLVATTKENNKIDSCVMNGWECYCPAFKEDAELFAIRNPQINEGNIGYMANKYHDEYEWFGYYKKNDEDEEAKPKYDFVVFVNSYNIDIMNRLQGCDWDVDSIYLTDSKLLTSKAKESQAWATPTNGIKGSTGLKKYNNISLAKLDNYLGGSTMSIGKIVNKSAIFNGYMYNAINKGYCKNYIEKCYEASSTLSSFSQIAIDMAKKNFSGLSLTKEMNKLNKTTYKNDKGEEIQILEYKFDKENPSIIKVKDYIKDYIRYEADKNYKIRYELINKLYNLESLVELYKSSKDKEIPEILEEKIQVYERKMIVPYFFTYIAKDNSFRIPTPMQCSMDYLEKILDELDTKAMQTDKTNIRDLLIMQKELKGGAYSGNKIDKVRKIIDNCQSILDKNRYNKLDGEEETKEKSNLRKWIKKESIKQLQKLKLNEKTVHRVLLRAFNIDKDYNGKKLEKTDKEGNVIIYNDWDLGEEFILTVKELKEMTMLVLTLIYNSYQNEFLNCFKEKKEKINTKRFWI